MRILLISTTFGRRDTRIYYRQAISLAKAGHEVTILCSDLEKEEINGNIRIISTRKLLNSRLKRIMFTNSSIKKTLSKISYDAVQISSPESLPLIKYFKRKDKFIVFDSREDYSAFISEKTWIPKFLRKPISFFYKNYEKRLLSITDCVIVTTSFLRNRFQIFHNNVCIVSNFPPLFDEINSKLDYSNGLDLCFFGTVSEDDMHYNVMEAIKNNENTRYHLLSAGNAHDNSKFLRMAKEIGVENNFFLSYKVPYEKIPQFLVNKNVGIIIRKYAANYGYRRGSLGVIKFFQYMSAGLPIICTDFDEWKTIIDENQCGIYVNPYDVNEIKNAILFLKDNPAVAKTMGDNAKKAFKTKYNWETQVGIYLDCFEK